MNFLKKNFSYFLLSFSLFLLTYIYYKSEIYWNGTKFNFYKYYYFVSLIIIFFSIITFFLSSKIKEYLIILIFSIIFGLYLYEGYLTFKKKIEIKQTIKNEIIKKEIYEKKTGKKFDTRNALEIYENALKKNNRISKFLPPFFYLNQKSDLFILSGSSNSDTIFCNENGYYAFFKSDRYGFNNPDQEWNKENIEYLLIGDSFVLGECVNRPHDIASVLRNLSKKTVLNLGYSGNGPLIEYATLREYLKSNTKIVLWFYYEGNDLWDLNNEISNEILVNYLKNKSYTQNLINRQDEIDKLVKIRIDNIKNKKKNTNKNPHIYNIIKFLKLYNLRFSFARSTKPQDEFKKILLLTKELLNKDNIKLYFVYLPEYRRYKNNYNNKNYNLIKSMLNQINIPFLDIHKEVFQKSINPLIYFPFEMKGHYNDDGYKTIAEYIYNATKEDNF